MCVHDEWMDTPLKSPESTMRNSFANRYLDQTWPRVLVSRYDLGCERWHLAVHLLDALFLNDEGHAAAGQGMTSD